MRAPVTTRQHPLPPLDERPLGARIGMLVLSTDFTVEHDFRRLLPSTGCATYVSRVAVDNPLTPESLAATGPRLEAAAALLLPDFALDAIAYCCTSASVVLGDAAVARAVRAAKPGTPVTTPALAARAAFEALGLNSVSVLTPYLRETSEPMLDYFATHGQGISNLHCLDMADDRDMAHLPMDAIIAAAHDTIRNTSHYRARDDADGLFISCTALRAASVVPALEAATGKPVVTSNQAIAWHTMQLCGIAPSAETVRTAGQLLSRTCPSRYMETQ